MAFAFGMSAAVLVTVHHNDETALPAMTRALNDQSLGDQRSHGGEPGLPLRAVLITSASSGLGYASALHLDRLGFQVFAGVRSEVEGEVLSALSVTGRMRPLLLDVTSGSLIERARQEVEPVVRRQGLWAVVNTAGVCVPGPFECLSPGELRYQWDVNVGGLVRLTQVFLPLLRQASGRLVNVGSNLGRLATPYLGAYASAQFAKEAISDVLRAELAADGVAVTLVRVGTVMTTSWTEMEHRARTLMAEPNDETAQRYRLPFFEFVEDSLKAATRSKNQPEDFAGLLAKILMSKSPKAHYHLGRDARMTDLAARMLPYTWALRVSRVFS